MQPMSRSAAPSSAPGSDADHEPALSVVIPVYNESDNITDLIRELMNTLDGEQMAGYRPYEVLLVDDGSTDGSRDILRDEAEAWQGIKAILLQRNFGQSAALAAGIDAARGDVIVTLDGDMQNDPSDVPQLLDKLDDGYDCVSGWRRNRQDSVFKTVPSKIQTYLAWLAGPKIHDYGCTLKAYRSQALKDADIYGEGHRYIPSQLHHRGYRVTELPVTHRPRQAGNTKYGPARLLKGGLDLVFTAFWNRFSTRPLHLMGSLGVLFMGVGLLLGLHAVFIKYVYSASLVSRTPRLILITLLTLFGLQLVLFGFLAEMVTKLHYRDEPAYRVERTIE